LNYKPEFTDKDISLYKFISGPYDNNGYLLICNHTKKSVIVDAPGNPVDLIRAAQETNTDMMLITHNHWDHLLGYKEITSKLNLSVGIGINDSDGMKPAIPDFQICDGQTLPIGEISLTAIHTPGHTEGSTCFLINNILFTGDTLFPGGPGKSKDPATFKTIIDSISTKLLRLAPSVVFYPGHGLQGTIAKAQEDYSIFRENPQSNEIFGDIEWLN
tara:strand:+ start:1994 stop:2641 length:648 start_codon:yes stop_codon:yes gene_type:complete